MYGCVCYDAIQKKKKIKQKSSKRRTNREEKVENLNENKSIY